MKIPQLSSYVGDFYFMKYRNWNDFKVPCASINTIMTRPKNVNDLTKRDRSALEKIQAKTELSELDIEKLRQLDEKHLKYLNPPLSETCKSYLIGKYGYLKYNVKTAKTVPNRPCVTKGIELEEQGIDLVSFIDKKQYKRPEGYVENEHIIGVCDAICLDDSRVLEVKTSWNAANFMEIRRTNKLSNAHWAQMQGYLNLYEMDYGIVCFVLANTPAHLIEQEKASLFKKYMFGEIDREKYELEIDKFESLFNFEKIPLNRRIIRFEVKRSEKYMSKVVHRIGMCREFLAEFDKNFMKNKIIVTSEEDYINVQSEEDNTEYYPGESLQSDQR